MKRLNIPLVMSELPKMPRKLTLDQITREVACLAEAINPYYIIAQKVISNLDRHLIYPFQRPVVVNPLEIDGRERRYLKADKKSGKFAHADRVRIFNMDEPDGVTFLLDENNMPFSVQNNELTLKIATREYEVWDLNSFKRFIRSLPSDIASLKPYLKERVRARNYDKHKYQRGDIVLLSNQDYAKVAVVRGVEPKQFLAELISADTFLTPRIGVNRMEMQVREKEPYDYSPLEMMAESRNISWATSLDPGELERKHGINIGQGAVLHGPSEYTGIKYSKLGYVLIKGFDTDCATVTCALDNGDKFPWGDMKQLSVPENELIYLGNLDSMENVQANLGADDLTIQDLIEDVTREEIDQPYFRGLISFMDLHRLKKVYMDLINCPQVPEDLVGAQFVKLITKEKIGGIEHLARITGRDVIELAEELLARDLSKVGYCIDSSGKKYEGFIQGLQDIVVNTTDFNSAEEFLESIGPQINLYKLFRDGRYTLTYLSKLHFGTTDFPIDPEQHWQTYLYKRGLTPDQVDPEIYQKFISEPSNDGSYRISRPHNFYARNLHILEKDRHRGRKAKVGYSVELQGLEYGEQEIGRVRIDREEMKFMDKNLFPDPDNILDEEGNIRKLLGVSCKIPTKDNNINYWRDRNDDLMFPNLQDLAAGKPGEGGFILHPITGEYELEFFKTVFKQVKDKVEFRGKDQFFKEFEGLCSKVKSQDDDDFTSRREMSDYLVGTIIPLYRGIRQLTQDPAVRQEIMEGLIGHIPMLVEAYHDYNYLKMMCAVRDHFWRNNGPEKSKYLTGFGWPEHMTEHGAMFEEPFFDKLASIDPYHRGFNQREGSLSILTKKAYGDQRPDYQTDLGLAPSPKANLMLQEISAKALRLGEGLGGKGPVGFLPGYTGPNKK